MILDSVMTGLRVTLSIFTIYYEYERQINILKMSIDDPLFNRVKKC